MQIVRTTILSLAVTAASFAARIDGMWTGELTTQNGAMVITLSLKAEGENLTGTVETPMGVAAIKEGKIKGDELSWVTVLERNGNSIQIINKAKVTGTEMTVTVSAEGRDGSAEFTVKRSS